MLWFDFLYRMCCCGMCCDQRLTNDCNSVTCKWCRKIQGLLGIGCFCPILMICWTGSAVLTTDFVIIARVFSNWHRRITCSWNHRSVRTTVRSMQDIASMFQSQNSYHDSCCYFPSKKIPFVLLLLLPSFARTAQVQVAAQFFKLVPDGSDLLPEDSQLGAERRKQWWGMWCDSQDHCGAAFQVARRIAPFMRFQVSLQRPACIP